MRRPEDGQTPNRPASQNSEWRSSFPPKKNRAAGEPKRDSGTIGGTTQNITLETRRVAGRRTSPRLAGLGAGARKSRTAKIEQKDAVVTFDDARTTSMLCAGHRERGYPSTVKHR